MVSTQHPLPYQGNKPAVHILSLITLTIRCVNRITALQAPLIEYGPSSEAANIVAVRPQFGLKALFCLTTWAASLAALAASHLAGWTVFTVGFSLSCLNCLGRLAACQSGTVQRRLFRIAWFLLAISLLLPSVRGCGDTVSNGWQAATFSFQLPYWLFSDPKVGCFAYGFYCLIALANLLLALSPLLLWRLQRGKGRYYGTLLPVAAAAMWCPAIDPKALYVGYYVWCLGGLTILCAYRMHWRMLPLMALPPLLIIMARL